MEDEKKYIISPIKYDDGTDSFTNFVNELKEKHKGEEEKYIAPLIKLVKDFQKYGPLINLCYSKSFPPYKNLDDIQKDLSEIRTYQCRYFMYKIDKFEWIGLCGYEKKGDKMPDNQKIRAKGEIKRWKEKNKRK